MSRKRIGVIEDHPVIVDGLRGNLARFPDLEIVANAPTVRDLLGVAGTLDLAILDLHGLPDGSRPTENILALNAAGISNILVFTYGERRDLIQEAARAGVLAVVLKTQPSDDIAEAINAAAHGHPVVGVDWAAALDADQNLAPKLTPRERQVLELYASGESAEDVAEIMQLKKSTVYSYVKSIKEKYADIGKSVSTKSELRKAARESGLI